MQQKNSGDRGNLYLLRKEDRGEIEVIALGLRGKLGHLEVPYRLAYASS
jgi:hypothetical protein